MLRVGVGTALAVLALGLAACGSAGAVGDDPDTPTAIGMCAFDTPDCVDVIVDDDQAAGGGTYLDPRELLGTPEDELPADVRVGRRGDEHMMLTEDYVLGRHTVELDADGDGVFRVTAVVTELPDGPETTRVE
jgi:hypothetical protein